MALDIVTPGVVRIAGFANMYLIEAEDGVTLIDAGLPGQEGRVLTALEERGRTRGDLKHIVLTHAHPDHIGSLAALVAATGARTYMHATDVPVAATGGPFRPMSPATELLPGLMFRLLGGRSMSVAPTRIDATIADGDMLPIAGGLAVIGTPGHSAGQVALLWRDVLFVGDAAMTLFGLTGPIGYEDPTEGARSQRKLAQRDFRVACFGHGRPFRSDASARFQKRWG